MRWKKVTLVGVGLLGGSLGLALRQRRLAGEVCGFVRRPGSIKAGLSRGALDSATLDLAEAIRGADLVIFCTPVLQMRALLAQALPAIRPGTIITDVGSVKGRIVRELEPLAVKAKAWFVGSHPMAGSEKTGLEAADGALFEHAVCVVTPAPASNRKAVRQVERLWSSVGGRVLRLSPETHDELVSRSSHLPLLLAAQLASLVLDPRHPAEQPLLCAKGFRDTTRVASGSTEMWRDIIFANRKPIERSLRQYLQRLTNLYQAIKGRQVRRVEELLRTAKSRRDGWMAGQGAAANGNGISGKP